MEGEGIHIDPKGNIVLIFACGLAKDTNNQVDQYTLYLGFDQVVSLGIQCIVLIGDSLLSVSQPRLRKDLGEKIVGRLQNQIDWLLLQFYKTQLFDV